MKRIPKIYLETTVFNYFFDRDRDGHFETLELFDAIGRGEFEACTSIATTDELEDAPDPKRTDMFDLIKDYNIKVLEKDKQVDSLSELYLTNNAIPRSHPVDATHIAMANHYQADYLATFNFKHINKSKTKQITDTINSRLGLPGAKIVSPGELL